jgi:hypothetical protein
VPVGTGIYDPAIDAEAEALLRKMSLEEKVGQLVQYGWPAHRPGAGRTNDADRIAKGQIGSTLGFGQSDSEAGHPLSHRDQRISEGMDGKRDPIANSRFAHQLCHVCLDGSFFDAQGVSDLLV